MVLKPRVSEGICTWQQRLTVLKPKVYVHSSKDLRRRSRGYLYTAAKTYSAEAEGICTQQLRLTVMKPNVSVHCVKTQDVDVDRCSEHVCQRRDYQNHGRHDDQNVSKVMTIMTKTRRLSVYETSPDDTYSLGVDLPVYTGTITLDSVKSSPVARVGPWQKSSGPRQKQNVK